MNELRTRLQDLATRAGLGPRDYPLYTIETICDVVADWFRERPAELVELVARAIHHPQSGRWDRDLTDWDRDYLRSRAGVVLMVLADEIAPNEGEQS